MAPVSGMVHADPLTGVCRGWCELKGGKVFRGVPWRGGPPRAHLGVHGWDVRGPDIDSGMRVCGRGLGGEGVTRVCADRC